MDSSIAELNKLPKVLNSTREALSTFLHIISSTNKSLAKILVQGDFSEFPDDQSMHSTARLAKMLGQFSANLQAQPQAMTNEFLMDEIKVLEKCESIRFPNFFPIPAAFLAVLSQCEILTIHTKPVKFITETWDYIEEVVLSVLTKYSENFPHIQSSLKRAGRNLIKEQSVNRVMEIVEMAKLTDYTCNPEYMTVYTQKIAAQGSFINVVQSNTSNFCTLTGFGNVSISHLRKYDAQLLRQAFDMKMRIAAYWSIVVRRIVDNLALYLQFSVKNFVNSQFQKEMEEIGEGDVEKMLKKL